MELRPMALVEIQLPLLPHDWKGDAFTRAMLPPRHVAW